MSVSVLAFSVIKSIKRLMTGIVLHSWGPDASFDTHIVLSRHFECQMQDVSFMHMASDLCHTKICQYGCQMKRQDLRNTEQCLHCTFN